MRWVTGQRVWGSRMLGGWMIKRFVDPKAEFVYVPNDTDPATVKDGTPWHIGSTAELSTHDGHAAWYWISKKYKLAEKDPVIAKMEAMFPLTRLAYVAMNEENAVIDDALPPGAPLEAAGLATVLYGVTVATKDPGEAMRLSGIIFDATYEALRAQLGRPRQTIDHSKHAVGG
ncbi:MAG: chromate resistance protein [Chloroflexi bacterium]|nr:MAG: chromate resistance protein [Chloroflexota bacterium]TMB75311.1 MAG: chromate resistance protein [Chloroflexota bacterium]TMC28937.1 MAG: chromate resistance protein [Chloroflexota bacterium]TMC32850.1 MAG: chromate resistance protein [Chloroflexota bacterium]TME36015.1 MAG: chromate resistance protein [Chloroflexota bacterium]